MNKVSILFVLIFLSAAIKAQENKGFVVVELFTSEGCSSCPPADKLLSDISNEAKKNGDNIYCLAFHVDYWNRLGWKDPFGKFQFTRRQENYSRVLPSKELFTPQMVVNGSVEFTGSDKKKADAAIQSAKSKKPAIQFDLKLDSLVADTAYISWTLSKTDANYVLQLAYSESGLSSKVSKGENAGKVLVHDHVVKVFSAVNKPGSKGQTKLILKDRVSKNESELTGFIQHKQNYKISAADRVKVQ